MSGPLVLDLDAASLTVDGRPVALTGTELRLLQALMERPGVVLSKAGLYEQVWGEPFVGDEASVKAHVSNLRGKLRQAGAPDDLGLDPRRLAPPPRAWPGSPGSVW